MSYITLHPPVLRNIVLFKEIQSVLIVSACLTGTQQLSAGSGSLSACLPACLPACVQLAVLDSHAGPLLQQTVFICQRLRFCLSSAAARSRREKARWAPAIKHVMAGMALVCQVENRECSGIPLVFCRGG